MSKFLMVTSVCILIPFSSLNLQASISNDIANNEPMSTLFNGALVDSLTINDIFQQIASVDASLTPEATGYATCNKIGTVEEIVSSAFSAAPTLAKEIADAARECGVLEEELLNSALAANIDPTTIGEATAAGGNAAGVAPTGAITGSPISPPSFSTGTGGSSITPPSISDSTGSGGGESASPST